MKNNLSSSITLARVSKKLYQYSDVLEQSRLTRRERIPCRIFETSREGALYAAHIVAERIRAKEAEGDPMVLSLVAGRSMTDLFAELRRMHKEEGLSFRNVVLLNLFEYYPLTNVRDACYGSICEQLLDHVDIEPGNVYNFNGTAPSSDIPAVCERYEEFIQQAGGVDLQLLGIGRLGNIGFNEAGSQWGSRTRLVVLSHNSRDEAKSLFGTTEQVPATALTMGLSTIMRAKEVLLLAWGEHKADAILRAVEGEADTACPASVLQQHANAQALCDLSAAGRLTRIRHPWLVTGCEWDDRLTRRAIVWLCEQTHKPILKLTNRDYNDYGLSELVTIYGSAYNCNIRVFNDIQHTITGWPGGKPDADDTDRPERALPYPKDVLIFSPHPDDDVISMGGTFTRLIRQNHNVHVAYETSGCIAVCDNDVVRYLDFMRGLPLQGVEERYNHYMNLLRNKKGDTDAREILDLKALIRRGEATAACRHMGLPESHIHFLNLPFYETGTVKKGDLSERDVAIVRDLLMQLRPHEMFVAGDLADPHGTHKVCLDAVLAAVDELWETQTWLHQCRIWMYRGAWMEWEADLIEMAVPMSPEELRHKRDTILQHQSQMESAPFMGNDERLFWQRAEDRNHATAALYARLGLADYEAIEAFVRYRKE